MEMQKLTGFGIKDCLTEASLGRNCFGTYNEVGDFYTFNGKYVRDFIRRSIKVVEWVLSIDISNQTGVKKY